MNNQLSFDANLTARLAVASLALILYDYFLSIHDEVEFIWKDGARGFGKKVYIWNRYFAIVTLSLTVYSRLREVKADAINCNAYVEASVVAGAIVMCNLGLVLMLRAWVLYNCSRILIWLFVPLLIAEGATAIYLGTRATLPLVRHTGSVVTDCFSLASAHASMASYPIPLLVVVFVVFLLTLRICGRIILGLRRTRTKVPLWNLFCTDGGVWLFSVLMVTIPHLVICSVARPSLSQVMIGPCLAVYSIIAARALLSIRKIRSDQAENTMVLRSTSAMNTIQFAPTQLGDGNNLFDAKDALVV